MSLNWEGEAAVIKTKLENLEKNQDRIEKEYEARIKELDDEVKKLEAQNEKLVSMANRWKGGGAVLIALGSALGAVLAYYENIKSIIAKLLS